MMVSLFLTVALAVTPIAGSTPAQVTELLGQLKTKPFAERLHTIADATLGTPYKDGPLGEGPGAKHDADPLIDLQHVDCVTFVEQSLALASSADYDQAVQRLQRLRYRGGQVDFGKRHHFFITDWIASNIFCTDISPSLGVETVALTRVISHHDFFIKQHAQEYADTIPDRKQTIHYVPSALGAKAEAKLPDAALIVFVGKIDWLFALHCGLYLRDADGTGHLYHASSKATKVTTTTLGAYLSENKERYLGFTAYSIAEPK